MTTAAVTSYAPQAAAAMTAAARDFLEALDAPQRAEAMFPFVGDERFVWHYTPVPRRGLSLKAMQPDQRRAALDLVATGLSPRGWSQAQQIMALETILDEWERLQGLPLRWRRDPEDYHLSVFGRPGDSRWAWRVCGHHLLTHITVVAQAHLACVPLFFGANPAEVRHGPEQGLRILSVEEDLARGLLMQLTPDQRRIAVVDPHAPDDILTKNYRAVQPGMAPRGLALGDMAQTQREQLVRLVRHYVDRSAGELAANAWRDIERAGSGRGHLRLGRSRGTRTRPLLRRCRVNLPDRIRQHAGRRESRPFGVARFHQRLRRRRAWPSTTPSPPTTTTDRRHTPRA